MKNKVVDFVNYRKLKLAEIQLNLSENHWGVIVVQISDEITDINKQLGTLRNTKNTILQNQYHRLYGFKELLINISEKIEEWFFRRNKDEIRLTFEELSYLISITESSLQKLVFIDREDTSEYRNLCYVYKALLPVYNQNKSILENLNATKQDC